ncbi:MAG: molybdopterin synthase sulfur carrier subunit [Candidatus Muproteobacteria bacterium RBG_16_65_34]|uniref:Molybdopterin synthase sulfur carrier subunit n=1 Tax=Candidatus Muproteobacteria bacterium RBG_16_65_34 TaxID=1817760 RepID=A0A1F6TPI0_9PROT|nr:MAG: molybdopterin synthase sulfur carrier subunit [Candidatus Muproteobacteria bacterium RBG_16_65_34]
MSITVRFFASIREKLGKGEVLIEAKGVSSASDVWDRVASTPIPPNTLVAINQEHVSLAQAVRDGDEVAFFPPITGGAT